MSVIIDWIVAHQTIVAALAVAILDFIFAVKADWQSNGILHWVYTWLKGIAGKVVS